MQGIGYLWIAAIIIFMIVEACTYQLVSIWFVLGAVGAAIAYFADAALWLQIAVFTAVSAVSFAILRPLSIKLVKRPKIKTNADSLIGREVLITHDVNNTEGEGQGKINGMTWTVRGESAGIIRAGDTATIKRIEGVKLIVEKQN